MSFSVKVEKGTVKPVEKKDFKLGITHGGKFHADDAMGCAILAILTEGQIKFERVLDVPDDIDEDTIVFDIGRGKFDHHQEDAAMRPTQHGEDPDVTHKYAASGLLWKAFGDMITGDTRVTREVDMDLIRYIDEQDNGEDTNLLSTQIGKFMPPWNSDKTMDEQFIKVVEMCIVLLSNTIESSKAKYAAEEMVKDAIKNQENPNIVVFDTYLPAIEYIIDENEFRSGYSKILYMVFPSKRGGWSINAVSVKGDRFKQIMPFPEEWRGKEDEELAKLTDGHAKFVHSVGFCATAWTKEDAIALAEKSIAMQMR